MRERKKQRLVSKIQNIKTNPNKYRTKEIKKQQTQQLKVKINENL